MAVLLILISFGLMGSSCFPEDDAYTSANTGRDGVAPKPEAEPVGPVDDSGKKPLPVEGEVPELAAQTGSVLLVRGFYPKNSPVERVFTVRIENPRNGWYDYVEWTISPSMPDSTGNTFNDFDFGFENFNKQTSDTQNYDPKDAVGDYKLTVTSNAGLSRAASLTWDGSTWAGQGQRALTYNLE